MNNEPDAEFKRIYREYKKIYLKNPSKSKKSILEEIGVNPKLLGLYQYINLRLKEDNLLKENTPIMEYNQKYTYDEFEDIYQEFKKQMETTSLSLNELFKQFDILPSPNCDLYNYINRRNKENNINTNHRWNNICTKQRIENRISFKEFMEKNL